MIKPTKRKWDSCSSKSKDSERLQEYIRPQHEFNLEVVNELTSKTQDFTNMKRFTVLLFDEMKVQEDLYWDKNNGNLLFYIL